MLSERLLLWDWVWFARGWDLGFGCRAGFRVLALVWMVPVHGGAWLVAWLSGGAAGLDVWVFAIGFGSWAFGRGLGFGFGLRAWMLVYDEYEKGIGWMPWRQEAMKDVARCENLGGAASGL